MPPKGYSNLSVRLNARMKRIIGSDIESLGSSQPKFLRRLLLWYTAQTRDNRLAIISDSAPTIEDLIFDMNGTDRDSEDEGDPNDLLDDLDDESSQSQGA